MITNLLIVGFAITPSSNTNTVGVIHQQAAQVVPASAYDITVSSRLPDLVSPMLTDDRRESTVDSLDGELFDGNIWIRVPERPFQETDVNAKKRQLKPSQLFRCEKPGALD